MTGGYEDGESRPVYLLFMPPVLWELSLTLPSRGIFFEWVFPGTWPESRVLPSAQSGITCEYDFDLAPPPGLSTDSHSIQKPKDSELQPGRDGDALAEGR